MGCSSGKDKSFLSYTIKRIRKVDSGGLLCINDSLHMHGICLIKSRNIHSGHSQVHAVILHLLAEPVVVGYRAQHH